MRTPALVITDAGNEVAVKRVLGPGTEITSGDEDAGRLELLHALPVARSVVWLGRWASSMLVLAAVAAIPWPASESR